MYIDDRISNYLEQIVQKNGLTLIHIDGTELDPDVANGRKRAIIINNNYKTNLFIIFIILILIQNNFRKFVRELLARFFVNRAA